MNACGTYGGYQKHLKRDEVACSGCRSAAAAYMRDYRRTRGQTQSVLVPVHVVEAAARQVAPGIAKALRATLQATP